MPDCVRFVSLLLFACECPGWDVVSTTVSRLPLAKYRHNTQKDTQKGHTQKTKNTAHSTFPF